MLHACASFERGVDEEPRKVSSTSRREFDAFWARPQETLKEYQEKKQAAGPSASLGRKVSEQHQQVLLASNRLLLCLHHSTMLPGEYAVRQRRRAAVGRRRSRRIAPAPLPFVLLSKSGQ